MPEIKVFHMLFERCHTKDRNRSIKQHYNILQFPELSSVGPPCMQDFMRNCKFVYAFSMKVRRCRLPVTHECVYSPLLVELRWTPS